MSLEQILLGMLREPASGYDLKRSFDENIRHFWSAELSQIYPTLQRLEQRGWLRSRLEPSEKGPSRRVYHRTAAGRRALVEWLQSGPQLGAERFAYLAQLVFLHELGSLEATRSFMQQLRERLSGWLELLEGFERDFMQAARNDLDSVSDVDFHEYMALRMGVRSLAAKVAWCDEVIEAVEGRMVRREEKLDA